jgi:hypothetical protein
VKSRPDTTQSNRSVGSSFGDEDEFVEPGTYAFLFNNINIKQFLYYLLRVEPQTSKVNRNGDFFPAAIISATSMGALAGSGGIYNGLGAGNAHQLIKTILETDVRSFYYYY